MCLKAATISYINTGFCPQLTVSRLQRVFGTGNALTCLYSLICWPTSPWSNLHYKTGHAAKLLQSCPTLCNPRNSSPPGSPIPGILQATILGWVAIPFARGSSQPSGWTQISCIAGRFFTVWAIREAHIWLNLGTIKALDLMSIILTTCLY